MNNMEVVSIGKVEKQDGESVIVLDKKYAKGLKGLQGFGHVQVLWWMHECDNERDRSMLVEEKPYVTGPEEIVYLQSVHRRDQIRLRFPMLVLRILMKKMV